MSFLFQGTWALAATTGGIAGVVHDDTGAPVAGATVTASSPSQTATTTTDAQGHFVFLVLQPDTYTLTVTKDGYQTTALAGNTVFADQTQQVALVAPRSIKVIAHVTGNAGGLVKPGVAGDIYNVTPAQQAASVALGGGGNLSSAYSAIASVPGLYVATGDAGWNVAVIVHGQNPFFTSFELEGIPVNRAFDNYPNTTETNLGLQELQLYTGGGPADITSNGVSGFINSVIKTGTYPGYANLTLGTASEAFWHLATLEAGGATPDRNFSYYIGISGNDQTIRLYDNNNGASVVGPGSVYQNGGGDDDLPLGMDPFFTDFTEGAGGRGVYQDCPESNPYPYPAYAPGAPGVPSTTPPGCWVYGSPIAGEPTFEDRENIVNLHFGIPREDGQRDDVQLFWQGSMEETLWNGSLTADGPGLAEGLNYVGYGSVCGFGCGVPPYIESYNYNLPFGTNVDPGGVPLAPTLYGMPSAPASVFADGCAGYSPAYGGTGDTCSLPTNDPSEDTWYNDMGALKVQWTHPFGETSYVRVFAYSLYSDWLMNSPLSAATGEDFAPGLSAPDYELNAHTTGGSIAYANQLTDTDLFSFEGNVTTATTLRWNNLGILDGYAEGGSEIGLISESAGKYSCYAPSTLTTSAGVTYTGGSAMPCYLAGYGDPNGIETSEYNYYVGEPAITGAAAAAGAQYESLWNGNTIGDYNSVRPLFWNWSIHDQWRPNDRWLFDVALRYDDFTENLGNGVNPQDNFQEQIIDNDVCWNPTLGVATTPLLPGEFPPAPINYETTCSPETIGTKTYNFVHPPFTDANVTGNQYTTYDWQPRFAFTYTQDPNTVWRFSAGRYAEPALSASDQYLFFGGGSLASSTWSNFLDQGFFSPEHEIPNMTSAQYNASFEHRFRGTNVSVKISPFYTATSNWLEDNFIGEDYVTQFPTGRAKNYGVEASLQDGDFSANGLSAMLSFTWTESLMQYQPLLGLNQIEQLNTQIENYNSLTKKGGGYECYTETTTAPYYVGSNTCGAGPNAAYIMNPYYDDSPQPLLNTNGWYPQNEVGYSDAANYGYCDCYNSPYVTAVILNWRSDRFAITPSIQILTGTPYGNPLDVDGVDPRDCTYNQNTTGIDPGNYACDYTTAGIGAGPYGYLAVPDPQTGTFASPGEYSNPSIAIANLQLSYDFPHVKLTLTAADLWHTCFGGSSEPWTAAYPPSQYNCGYQANEYYNGAGWYNGTSPYDKAANFVTPYAWEQQSYTPLSPLDESTNSYFPFNLYLQAQIHI